MIGKSVPVLYLDLDGTVREGKDDALGKFVNYPEDVRIFPEALEKMRLWKEGGGRIVGVTNQGGIALGIVTFETVSLAIGETILQCDGLFDQIQMCCHHPNADNPEFARCWCRKPAIGMIVQAAIDMGETYDEIYPPHMALMVGDREEDRLCAERASIDFQWASDWRAS